MSRLKVDAAALRNEASRMRTVSYRIDDMANRAAKVARDSKGHSIHYEYGGNVKALTGELRQEARKLRNLATALEKTARTYENAENRVISNLNWESFTDRVSSVYGEVSDAYSAATCEADLIEGILDGAEINELPKMPKKVSNIIDGLNVAAIVGDFGEDWKEQMDSGEAGYSASVKAAEHAAVGIVVSEAAGVAVGSLFGPVGAVAGAFVGTFVGVVIVPKVTEAATKVIDKGYDCYEQNYIDMKGNVPCKM